MSLATHRILRRPSASHRLAAVGALLLALLALVGAAIALTASVGVIIIVVFSIALTIVGAWEAMTRRGFRRLLGLVVAVVAVPAALVIGVAYGEYNGLRAVVTAGLTVLSLVLGRYALSWRSPGAGAVPSSAVPSSGVRVPPARRPYLLMNPKSGGGKVEKFNMVEEAKKRGIESHVLQFPGDDLVELAHEAVERGADVIGMAGGDGSQAAVAAVAAEHGVAFVCVPVGTRMDFARDLGVDHTDPVGSLDAFGEARERRIDLARVGDRVFVNNVSLGLYGSIVQADGYREAKLKTAADMLPDLLGGGQLSGLRFTGPDGREFEGAQIIQVSNNPYDLQSLAGFASRPRLDTGALGLLAAKIEGPGQAAKFVALEMAQRVRSFPGWLEWADKAFEVRSDSPIDIAIDGEAVTVPSPIRFEILPAALRVRMPLHAPGLSAAARAELRPTWSVGDLIGTIGGRGAAG